MTYDTIPFNIPLTLQKEMEYIEKVISNRRLCGDGQLTKSCNQWFVENTGTKVAILTTSCTAALEMSAVLLNIGEKDEVIIPSFSFVSTALAFTMQRARIIFVDIDPLTMNISVEEIDRAISPRTKAVIPVHYAGISCPMDEILALCNTHGIAVIEDAAMGMMATYKGRALGTLGDFGTYSLHETKNYTCGEGGVMLINNPAFCDRADILKEKGTNRSDYMRGVVDKYTWVDKGSSWIPSELNAAYLYPQLLEAEMVNAKRLEIWRHYHDRLKEMEGRITLPHVPEDCEHNAHIFYIKCKNLEERTALMTHLNERGIQATFHYVPLHSAPAGLKYGEFRGEDKYTTKESERLLRLPMYYGLATSQIDRVCEEIWKFYA